MTTSHTRYFRWGVPDFDSDPWHSEFDALARSIDRTVYGALIAAGAELWENSTAYEPGNFAIDSTTGAIYVNTVSHTSAASPTTFATDRANHPTYWNVIDISGGINNEFVTRATLLATDLTNAAFGDRFRFSAFATAYDGGEGVLEKVDAIGSGVGYGTSIDGSLFRRVDRIISTRSVGAVDDAALDGTFNATSALTDMVGFYNNNPDIVQELHFDPIRHTITAPLPVFSRPAYIHGGVSLKTSPSIIWKRFVEASSTLGYLSFTRYLPRLEHLCFKSDIVAHGASGGACVSIITPQGGNAGDLFVEKCFFQSGDGCNYGMYIDGSANTDSPQGARNLHFLDTDFFGAAGASLYLKSCHNVYFAGCVVDSTGGSGVAFVVTGTTDVGADNINFQGLMASMQIDHATRINIKADTGNIQIGNKVGGSFYTGTTTGTSGLDVYGNVEGDVIINSDGAYNITIWGNIEGDVSLTGTIDRLIIKGKVFGDIVYNSGTVTNCRFEDGCEGSVPAHGTWANSNYVERNALLTYTSTVSSGTGTLGASPTAGVRYKRRGKMVDFVCDVSIPNNGSGASYLEVLLPIAGKAASNAQFAAARTDILGDVLAGIFGGVAVDRFRIYKTDGTYPAASGATFVISGSYETA